jgi:hypothetical protein
MNTYKSFPDLARSFQKMKLQDQLDALSERTIFGACILQARANKRPLSQISAEVLDQYQDNPEAVLKVIPEETINLMKQLYGSKTV